jgi:hypothetical protein
MQLYIDVVLPSYATMDDNYAFAVVHNVFCASDCVL